MDCEIQNRIIQESNPRITSIHDYNLFVWVNFQMLLIKSRIREKPSFDVALLHYSELIGSMFSPWPRKEVQRPQKRSNIIVSEGSPGYVAPEAEV